MAKSLRSKFKRKIKAIKRVKNAPKADQFLANAIEKQKEAEAKEDAVMKDGVTTTDDKGTIDLKTMKKEDGNYPSWLSGRLKKKAAAKNKSEKNKKKKNAAKNKKKR